MSSNMKSGVWIYQWDLVQMKSLRVGPLLARDHCRSSASSLSHCCYFGTEPSYLLLPPGSLSGVEVNSLNWLALLLSSFFPGFILALKISPSDNS